MALGASEAEAGEDARVHAEPADARALSSQTLASSLLPPASSRARLQTSTSKVDSSASAAARSVSLHRLASLVQKAMRFAYGALGADEEFSELLSLFSASSFLSAFSSSDPPLLSLPIAHAHAVHGLRRAAHRPRAERHPLLRGGPVGDAYPAGGAVLHAGRRAERSSTGSGGAWGSSMLYRSPSSARSLNSSKSSLLARDSTADRSVSCSCSCSPRPGAGGSRGTGRAAAKLGEFMAPSPV